MFISFTVVRYPKYLIPVAFMSMAILRLPLLFTKGLSFWKLLGCGKNGTFDLSSDLQQWSLIATWNTEEDFNQFLHSSFVQKWWKTFTTEQWTLLCIPYESHGQWSGQEPFSPTNVNKNYQGKIAVLTRASIKLSKAASFWKNVPAVSASLNEAEGVIVAVAIGEMPLIRQATFTVWESLDDVKNFAYRQRAHAEAIKKTRSEQWFSEELFARFIPIKSFGSIQGIKEVEINNVTV